ncbi:MAG: ABC transporter ATP-binding protein, partial [Deltaproteobacteria bacterium]|nr:ABC transporter ATP-binding protein [Deltaproteobacteria bacterium]
MKEIILKVENLTVGYKKPVLKDLNFETTTGSMISILGPNGVGKTTLLRTISRHIPKLGGEIYIYGKPLRTYKVSELAKVLSVVMTDKAAPPLLSVWEFVALGRHPHTGFLGRLRAADEERVGQALLAVKAENLADRLIEELSDGERQKVTLARALAQDPQLMLLDEPTAHLDLKHRVEVMGILRSLCRERNLTVLAAIHDVDMAGKVSDQVITLKSQSLAAFGRPEDILTSLSVSKLYDFERAGFSSLLGGIEIRGDGAAGKVFVVAGEDRGSLAFRFLSKKGYSLACGILGENDLDTYVARALGVRTFILDDPQNATKLLEHAEAELL